MAQLYVNNAASVLTLDISPSDTGIAIRPQDADEFPVADGTDFFKVTLEDADGNIEIIKVLARGPGSSSFSTVVRGQEGTTPLAFPAGSAVECRLTAEDIQLAIGHPSSNPAHAADHISLDAISGLSATNVQDGIEEVNTNLEEARALASQVFVARAGDTMTGPLTLHADPTHWLGAATKQYVDNKVDGGSSGNYVSKTDPSTQTMVSGLVAPLFRANAGVLTVHGLSSSDDKSMIAMNNPVTRYIENNAGVLNFVGFSQVQVGGTTIGGTAAGWTTPTATNLNQAGANITSSYGNGMYKLLFHSYAGAPQWRVFVFMVTTGENLVYGSGKFFLNIPSEDGWISQTPGGATTTYVSQSMTFFDGFTDAWANIGQNAWPFKLMSVWKLW